MTPEGQRAELAAWFHYRFAPCYHFRGFSAPCETWADALLADVLVEYDWQVRAQALDDAADAMAWKPEPPPCDDRDTCPCGGHPCDKTVPLRTMVSEAWLRARASTERERSVPRCHCGRPVAYGYDGDPTHHRGMCKHCDSVRCDIEPGACCL